MNLIRVLIVRPGEQPQETRIQDNLETMQAVVKGWIEIFTFADGVDMIFNEEGIAKNLPVNRFVKEINRDIVGSIMLARHDTEGKTISLTDTDIEKYTARFAIV